MKRMILLTFLLIPCLAFSESSSQNYRISISDQNAGGGVMASANYKAINAIGQCITGASGGSSGELFGGLFPIIVIPLIGTPTVSTSTFTSSNNNVKVYPNPYKKGDANFGGDYIYFDNVSQGATIRIYNIAGELIKEIGVVECPQRWNVSCENIASGVYIYTVTGGDGGKSVGKIGVIR